MASLVQLMHPERGRAVALVDGEALVLLSANSVYELAAEAARSGARLASLAMQRRTAETLDYAAVHALSTSWRFLPPFDHPEEPARCLVTGTGLTHKASVDNRNAMHEKAAELTDSMKMYYWGLDGGRPAEGAVGVAPEWFYKGSGEILRGHGEPLEIPCYGEDGGEEPEIAGVYFIDETGGVRRVGLTMANEFSDHRVEKKNYLYLAHSKLRTCAIGPELVLDPAFADVRGTVTVERGGAELWSSPIKSGEDNMAHSLANLEHHHFKYARHRRPGDAHIHFFGASAFSFGAGVVLEEGDTMVVQFGGFGRPLRNTVAVDRSPQSLVGVRPL
ncbi:MAG: GguC protein [Acidobacteria bacterium]|nr:GguC protein [Acidobacteriota bacterium]